MFSRAAIGGAIAILACAPIAYADSAESKFLAALSSQGVTGDQGQLLADGRAACDNYGGPGLVGQMAALEGRGLSNVQAQNIIVDGVRAFCPERSPLGPL